MTYGRPTAKWISLTFTVLAFIVSPPYARPTHAQEISNANPINAGALRPTNAGIRSELASRVLVMDQSKPIEDDQVESESAVVIATGLA